MPPAKRNVPVIGSKQIEAVRVWKSIRIAVRCGKNRHNSRSLLDSLAAKLHFRRGNSRSVLHWRLEAQQLLNGRANDLGAATELFERTQGCEAATEIHLRSGWSSSHDRQSA